MKAKELQIMRSKREKDSKIKRESLKKKKEEQEEKVCLFCEETGTAQS